MSIIACLFGLLAIAGLVEIVAGYVIVRRFARRTPLCAKARPPLSVLKPLAGDEPCLEDALASFCEQDYPEFQIVLGVTDPDDSALPVARRIAARFARADVTVVVGGAPRTTNRKVGNLIAMLPAAKHQHLVIADADVHAPAGYFDAVAAAFEEPSVGLVTALYRGLPGAAGWPARFGASQITHGFLPDALLGRAVGRQDAFGATLALTRETLVRSGGFSALQSELADDAVLGRRVRALGLAVGLAAAVTGTTVPERTFAALFRHELRWGRTIRGLAPVGYALSALRYPLAMALAAVAFSAAAPWSIGLFVVAWVVRSAAARGIDRALGVSPVLPGLLMPLRDLFSLAVLLASYAGSRVEWRGLMLRAGRPGGGSLSHAPQKGLSGR